MPREVGPERNHFGGEGGLVTVTHLGRTRYFWRCDYCNWQMGGKHFQNGKARIHLSGDASLRNGMISTVCHAAPDNVKKKFSDLERLKRQQKQKRFAKRQRANELLKKSSDGTPPQKQSKLLGYRTKVNAEEVDKAWGQAFFGLDIPAAKIDHELFREAIELTKRSRPK